MTVAITAYRAGEQVLRTIYTEEESLERGLLPDAGTVSDELSDYLVDMLCCTHARGPFDNALMFVVGPQYTRMLRVLEIPDEGYQFRFLGSVQT